MSSPDLRSGLLALPGVLVALIPLVMGLVRGPTLDASVFAVIAEQMRGGLVPYRDFFDHKPPLIYLTEWATGAVLPFVDAWTRAWGITVAAAVGTLILLAWRLGGTRPIGTVLALAATGVLLGAGYFTQGGGYTESLAVLPTTAAMVVAAHPGKATVLRAFAAGVLVGLGGAASFQATPIALGVLACLALAGGGLRAIAAYVAGGTALAIVLLGWLIAAGALPAALDQLVWYNRAYVGGQTLLHPVPLLHLATALLVVLPLAAAAAVRAVEILRRRDGEPIEVGALVAVAGWIVTLVIQGHFIGHYAIVLAAPLAILAAPVLDRFTVWFADGRTRLLATTTLVFAAALSALVVVATEQGIARRAPIDEASAMVAELTPADGRLFVWGNEPYVYLLTGREPAGRYVYQFPLTRPTFTTDAMVTEVLEDWERDPPSAIVDASIHWLAVSAHPLFGEWVFAGDPVPDRLDPLRAFVRDDYHVAATVAEWRIYVPN